MNISAAMVKELREKTGAGMMDCKKALMETGGDIEAAVDWLRKKGLSKAAKKSDRVAAEGLVSVEVKGEEGVVVELNAETDFVSRNDDFQKLARTIAQVALAQGITDIEVLKQAAYPGGGTVEEAITNAVATIGENMGLRRLQHLKVASGIVGHYVHGMVSEGLGRIGVLVALESAGKTDVLSPLARQIALHIAAASPLALSAELMDQSVVAREAAILREKNADKPAHVQDKIVESGLKTYYKEVCLLDQVSIHGEHQNKTIAQLLKEAESAVGAPVALTHFARYVLGEGVEKQQSDFAAEVAAAVGG